MKRIHFSDDVWAGIIVIVVVIVFLISLRVIDYLRYSEARMAAYQYNVSFEDCLNVIDRSVPVEQSKEWCLDFWEIPEDMR